MRKALRTVSLPLVDLHITTLYTVLSMTIAFFSLI